MNLFTVVCQEEVGLRERLRDRGLVVLFLRQEDGLRNSPKSRGLEKVIKRQG